MKEKNLGPLLPSIAELDTDVTLQSFTTAADSYGGLTKTWVTYETLKAKIEYSATGSGEDYDQHINLSVLRIVATVRWITSRTVSVKDRLVLDSENYDIRKITQLGRRRYLQITAERKL